MRYQRYAMRNDAGKRKMNARILPLNARMNGRDVVCLGMAALALLCALWGRKTRTMLVDELIELKDMALTGGHLQKETRLNLFTTTVVMRDGSKNETLMRAVDDLANLVVDKYLEVRPDLIQKMVDMEAFEWDPTHTYVRVPEDSEDMMFGKNFGYLINNMFYNWQNEQKDNAEKNARECVNERQSDIYDKVCQKHLVEDEWPEVYTSKAFEIVAQYIRSTSARTTPQGAAFVNELEEDLAKGDALVRGGLVSMWFSVHSPGVFHDEHNHEHSGLAGTFYLRSSNSSGNIVWLDPRLPHTKSNLRDVPLEGVPGQFVDASGDLIDTEIYLFKDGRRGIAAAPSDGLLVLFPPWTYHQVGPTAETYTDAAKSSPSAATNVDDSSHTARWQTDVDRSSFRVALSFNIHNGWTTSVDYSTIDLYDPSAAELLRQNFISPTKVDNVTWMYSEDEELRKAMLASVQ